ncbi:hypothetical protein INT44_007833 [Umbelopsis vinacea]|uniref:Uncharacterized protein n=1 Tax=Umbelopsis vinacea TaxID=44442 RepID=A0A8H7PKE8_9FUNG|nr:hypothetical protein INT44_007833 [Umbelopsis vinacea]
MNALTQAKTTAAIACSADISEILIVTLEIDDGLNVAANTENVKSCVYALCTYDTTDEEAYKEHLREVHNLSLYRGNQSLVLPGVGPQPSAPEHTSSELLAPGPRTVIDKPLASTIVTNESTGSVLVIAGPSALSTSLEQLPAWGHFTMESQDSIEDPSAIYTTVAGPSVLEPSNPRTSTKRRISDLTDDILSEGSDRRCERPAIPWLIGIEIPSRTGNVQYYIEPRLRRSEAVELADDVLLGLPGSISEGMKGKVVSNRKDGLALLSLQAVPNAMDFSDKSPGG